MAGTHVLQHVAGFVIAMWWTKHWLMDNIVARWRFAVSALSGAILWFFVYYTATNEIDTSGGVTISFGSTALAYFGAFMAFASVIGMILGLLLWAQEEGQLTADQLPDAVQTEWGD